MKNALPAILVLFCFFFSALPARAQTQTNLDAGLAETHESTDAAILDGDIVSLQLDGTVMRTNIAYDERMFGVVDHSPVMLLRRPKGNTPVARSGYASVNVTTLSGPIQPGDFITSSDIVGKGQKSIELSGYVVGKAVSSFSDTDGAPFTHEGKTIREGKVRVALGIGPGPQSQARSAGGLFGQFGRAAIGLLGTIRTSEQTDRLVRTILAGFVAIATMFINFHSFGRNVTKGIESIGRNPLAKVAIQSMILVNIMLIAIVSIGGILLALAILNL